VKTNSGDGIWLMCSKNADFHGAGLGPAVEDVEAMLRDWNARLKWDIRGTIREAMVAILNNCFSRYCDCLGRSVTE